MAELAQRLGYGEQYPQTEEALLRVVLDGSGHTPENVRAAGTWVKIPTPFMEYRKWEKGGLRADGKPGFETPTGKFEIWSTALEDHGYEPLPKYTEPREGPLATPDVAARFPLVFNSGARTHTDFRSQHHGIDGLVRDSPEPLVEINEHDAKARGICSGDLVEVQTPHGSVSFRARVTANIIRGAVECNMGGGTPVGPTAWQSANVNELTDLDNSDEISGFPVYKALLCDVVRVQSQGVARRGERGRTSAGRAATMKRRVRARPVRRIYLDNNATTGVAEVIREAMLPHLGSDHGNPSSIYGAGRTARKHIDQARRQVARLINVRPRRVVFTGAGSEANNLALKGAAFAARERGNHVITSTIEHPSVLEACGFLERNGYQVTYCGVDAQGMVDPRAVADAITDETTLVSIMMANNETGTLQPIKEIASIAREHGILFHTDAVQAIGKVPVDAKQLGVDMMSISGHKFHAPKGIGALYVRKGVPLEPLVHGGGQEGGLRAGTENVPAIVGMGKAAELATIGLQEMQRIAVLRDRLDDGIRKLIPDARLNGHPELRLPNTLNLTLPGLRGESLVLALDQYGVSLSSGSACKSGSPEPTHVLLAMGVDEADAHCALRISLSRNTTKRDVTDTLSALGHVLDDMETMIRFLPCK